MLESATAAVSPPQTDNQPSRARPYASSAMTAPCDTVSRLFLERVRQSPDAVAYRYPGTDGAYVELTWSEAAERVRFIASGLLALGLRPGDCCAIIAGTRIEWILIELAVLCAGGATSAIYPTSPAEDCAFILADAGSTFAFVENAEQLAKAQSHRSGTQALRHVIVIDALTAGDESALSLATLMQLGRKHQVAHADEFERTAIQVEPAQLATLVYTSGTTGRPKGVRLSHDGWIYQTEVGEALGLFQPSDHQYVWLPLAYVFGKLLVLCAIRAGSITTVDGRAPLLMDNLRRVRPTMMGAPPRVFEKVFAAIAAKAERAGRTRRVIFEWACRVGRAVARLRSTGHEPNQWLRLQYLAADRLVFSKVREVFGGSLRYAFSGGAPLRAETAEFFHAAGVPVWEGYGLTETSAGAVLNRAGEFRFGSVGKPNPGTELRVAADGEILLRSRGVMLGYHGLPEETRATLMPDGWLRTGDIGEVDGDGFLFITDRKRDVIKTSLGLFVAPQKLENALRAECPYLAFAFVHGERRSFCTALVALDLDATLAWARAERLSLDPPNASRHPAVGALIQGAITRMNARHPKHEAIRKFSIINPDLSLEAGLVTANMKVRRQAVEHRYRTLLDGFYPIARAAASPNLLPEWIVTEEPVQP